MGSANRTPACPLCGGGLIPSSLRDYPWQCVDCDEDFCDIEAGGGIRRLVGKTEIVKSVAARVGGVSRKKLGDIIDELVNEVRGRVLHGQVVSLPGLGTLKAAPRAPRVIKMPGAPTLLAPRRVLPLFHTAKEWRDMFPNDKCRPMETAQ